MARGERTIAPEDWPPTEAADAFRYYPALARLAAWIEGHYSGDVSLRAAARVAGLNAKYFSRLFHEKTGIRYSQWVHATRVSKAMQRLRGGVQDITHLALDVGYRDLRTFERAFKRHAGVTPREYRARVRPRRPANDAHT